MSVALNKITGQWLPSSSTAVSGENWIVDPVFDDAERGALLGVRYWRFPGGTSVHVLTDEEIETDPLLLADIKSEVKSKIKAYRDAWQFERFSYDNKSWDCDSQSRMNIMGLMIVTLANGGTLPEGQQFRDHNNNDWPVTGTYMIMMGITLLSFVNACYVNSWAHKMAIDNLTTVSSVKAYDYTTGWPSKG